MYTQYFTGGQGRYLTLDSDHPHYEDFLANQDAFGWTNITVEHKDLIKSMNKIERYEFSEESAFVTYDEEKYSWEEIMEEIDAIDEEVFRLL